MIKIFTVIFVVILILFLFGLYSDKSSEMNTSSTPEPTISINYNKLMEDSRKPLSRIERLERENEELKRKMYPFYDSARVCNKDPENYSYPVEYLPDELKALTENQSYKDHSSKTYTTNLIGWSPNCRYLVFSLELIARGGGAYTEKDFLPRGVYLLDETTKSTISIKLFTEKEFIDTYSDDPGRKSNVWIQDQFKFTLTTVNSSSVVGTNYTYNPTTKSLLKSD